MPSGPGPGGRAVPSPSKTLPEKQAVFLTGFMGSGKTSVGLALARVLGWRFEDLDARIEAQEQRSISEIFQHHGEPEFRRIERQALKNLMAEFSCSPAVVALGGGTFAQPTNCSLLLDGSIVTVFLDAPVEELWARCQQQPQARPLRQTPEHFRNLYQARLGFYTRAGLHIQTSGKSVEAVAEEIAGRLRCNYQLKESSR